MSKEFIDFVKNFTCSVCCFPDVDAHHLDTIGMGGNRKKDCLEDFSCVPLCRQHHQEWHKIGDTEFHQKYYINLWKVNYQMNKLWRKSRVGIS